jgi:hypothetical protein
MAERRAQHPHKDKVHSPFTNSFSPIYINMILYRKPERMVWMYKGIISPVSKHHIMKGISYVDVKPGA